MHVGNDTTTGDGGLDQGVQLLIATDGELQVAGSNTLHLQILGGIAGQLEHLSSQVLQDGSGVHRGGGTNTTVGGGTSLEQPGGSVDGTGVMDARVT